MNNQPPEEKKDLRYNFIIVTIILVTFLAWTISGFTSTLLVDLSNTFKVSIGTVSQLAMISYVMGLIMGFAMGFLAVKFKHKSLYLIGIALFAVASLGYFFSQTFLVFLLWSAVGGAGGAMFGIIGQTMIGELLPLNRRGWVMGLWASSIWLAFVIVGPLSGFIDSIAGWRSVLLWFVFPYSLICLVLVFLFIPSKQSQQQSAAKPSYKQAFQQVLLNKSAIACMTANAFSGFLAIVGLYGVSFYRISFDLSPSLGGIFAAIAFAGGIFGALTGGRLVNRMGRKNIAVTSNLAAGALTIIFTFVPNAWFSLALWSGIEFCIAMGLASAISLTLEQVPGSLASMMSVNLAITSIGWIVAVIIGGLVLNLYQNNFHVLMAILGGGGVATGLIFLLAKDPCKTR